MRNYYNPFMIDINHIKTLGIYSPKYEKNLKDMTDEQIKDQLDEWYALAEMPEPLKKHVIKVKSL